MQFPTRSCKEGESHMENIATVWTAREGMPANRRNVLADATATAAVAFMASPADTAAALRA
jgi:hypothetical protein